jgi:hypothetical protein
MGVGKCQTAAATPAEPGDLPRWVSVYRSRPKNAHPVEVKRPRSGFSLSRQRSGSRERKTAFNPNGSGRQSVRPGSAPYLTRTPPSGH